MPVWSMDRCVFAGVSQADSAVCSSVCQLGKWACESVPIPGVCAVEEGSHFTTFDGKEFSFHGDCYYVLSKVCIYSLFYKCLNGQTTV